MSRSVAVCIAGQARLTDAAKAAVSGMLIEPLRRSGMDVDVYVHMWANQSFDRKVWEEGQKMGFEEVKSWLAELRPSDISVQPPINFFNQPIRIRTPIREAPTYESQYYSVEMVRNLMRRGEQRRGRKYDLLIKTRIDLIYRNEFDPAWMRAGSGLLCIPDREGHKWTGENPPPKWPNVGWMPDQLWAGDRNAVDFLMSFREAFHPSYVGAHGVNNIERMLYRYYRPHRKKWQIERIPLIYKIEKTANNK
jgi:hypothetical protein